LDYGHFSSKENCYQIFSVLSNLLIGIDNYKGQMSNCNLSGLGSYLPASNYDDLNNCNNHNYCEEDLLANTPLMKLILKYLKEISNISEDEIKLANEYEIKLANDEALAAKEKFVKEPNLSSMPFSNLQPYLAEADIKWETYYKPIQNMIKALDALLETFEKEREQNKRPFYQSKVDESSTKNIQ